MKTNSNLGWVKQIAAAFAGLALILLAAALIQASAAVSASIPQGSPNAGAVYQQDWPAHMTMPDLRCIAAR